MRIRKLIFSLTIIAILWSCSSYVRFTSDNLDDIKTYGNLIYDGSKQIIEALEEELKTENKSNKFEGKLLNSSKKWLGTPYQYGGTSHSGIDCSGFVLNVYEDMGYELPRTSQQQYGYTTKISSGEKQIGDLVFFRRGSDIGHVGIYLGSNKMIHASTSRGVIIQDLNNEYLQRTFAGFGRVPR
ncbi:NlpC/P60 family protein [bacterium]|nr:MAG: NlpC/P60 family protein [bacterium]